MTFESLGKDYEAISDGERGEFGFVEGPMSELLAMSGKENAEVFKSLVLDKFGISPETIDLLDDATAREYMKNFVSPLFDDEIREKSLEKPDLLNIIAQEAADELRRLANKAEKKAA